MITAIFGAGNVPSQLHSDVGKITPLFLPIASEPAVFKILKTITNHENIHIFLPKNFTDAELLKQVIHEKNGVEVKCHELEPNRNRLIDTFISASEVAIELGEDLEIIFGDTISGENSGVNQALVHPVTNSTRWTTCDTDFKTYCTYYPKGVSKGEFAVVGRFHFSEPKNLLEACLELSRSPLEIDLSEILYRYSESTPNFNVQKINYWIDLGHLDTYFSIRKSSVASRSFNQLQMPHSYPSIVKSSTDIWKIRSEIDWYKSHESLNESVAPRLLDWNYEMGNYKLEWIPFLTVGETLSFAKMDMGYWESFVRALDAWSQLLWKEIAVSQDSAKLATHEIFIDKLLSRWDDFKSANHQAITSDHKLKLIAEEAENNIFLLKQILGNLINRIQITSTGFHGDPVFSNLFFDIRSEKLLSIDPRGSYGSQEIWGTQLYDLAKISQSFFGKYDMVVADLFKLNFHKGTCEVEIFPSNNLKSDLMPIHTWIEQKALKLGITLRELRIFEASLWFSLAVLHDESPKRQMAALAIANRIMKES